MDFQAEQKVTITDINGGDYQFLAAAQVVPLEEAIDQGEKRCRGVIKKMMSLRHGSPFEQGMMRFMCEATIFVTREFERHRIGFAFTDEFSLNVESGRYRQLQPKAWLPDRKTIFIPDDFKPMEPKFIENDQMFPVVLKLMADTYEYTYSRYEELLSVKVAKEVARAILPVGMFTKYYVQVNPRSLMHFLSLRTQSEIAKYPSFPQWEIQQVAKQLEAIFAVYWPFTYEYFNEFGRVAP
jgi:thymidylate synthase (FAD)